MAHLEKMVSTVPLAQLELEELLELQEHPERMGLTEPLAQPVTLVKMVHPVALVLLEHLEQLELQAELLDPLDLQEPPDLTVLPVPLAKEDSPDQLELLVLEDSTVLMVAPELLVLPVKTDLLELLAVMAQSDPLEHLVPLVKTELLVALVPLDQQVLADPPVPPALLDPNRDSPSKLPCLRF